MAAVCDEDKQDWDEGEEDVKWYASPHLVLANKHRPTEVTTGVAKCERPRNEDKQDWDESEEDVEWYASPRLFMSS